MVNKNSLAVVVVDAVSPRKETAAILNLCKVLDYARGNSIPTFLLTFVNYSTSEVYLLSRQINAASASKNNAFARETVQKDKLLRLDARVIESAGESAVIVVKMVPGAFNCRQTFNLQYHLDKIGANCLIVGGFDSHVCVYDTIVGAVSRSYSVITSPDLMYSSDNPGETYRYSLPRCNRAGGEITFFVPPNGGAYSAIQSFYRKNTDFKENYRSVIKAMEKLSNPQRSNQRREQFQIQAKCARLTA